MLTILASTPSQPIIWGHAVAIGLFVLLVLAMLALDLGLFHRKAHAPSFREALGWTVVWVSVALLFNVAVYFLYESHVLDLGLNVPILGRPGVTETVNGATAAKTFIAAYLLEKSLSMDNVFVIAVLFASIGIPSHLQHRVLFWGILGALVMRGLMIALGAAMVSNLAWTSYVFGGVLLLTAVKMCFTGAETVKPELSFVVRTLRRVVPLADRLDGQRFFTRIDGRLMATPLLVALALIEFTDLIFAVDSIPAVFALTADPFIVFTSNIMAILGLRSLYFCLATLIPRLRYLKPSLIIVLMFAGAKMCLVHTPLKVPLDVSLLVVLGVLAAGAALSLIADYASRKGPPSDAASRQSPPKP